MSIELGSRGKRVKSELGSGSKGKRLKSEAEQEQELKLEAELKQKLKSEAEQAELKQKSEAEQLELIKKLLKPEAERVELIKKRLKSKEEQVKLIEKLEAEQAELKQKVKTKLDGDDVVERDLSKYDDMIEPYMYKDGDFVHKNKAWKESEVAVEEYKKLCRELRPTAYDGMPPPPMLNSLLTLCGGGPYSCAITDNNRPTLTAFCHLALRDYNQRNQGPTFVFHQLVKCSLRQAAFKGYYITFQAKAQEEEDPSNSPAAITTFQALVWKGFEEELPLVQECKIKI